MTQVMISFSLAENKRRLGHNAPPPHDQWSTNQKYNNMHDFVTRLEVGNDMAEKEVKDIQDYANAA